MKKTTISFLCLILLSVTATAQIPIKVHSNGRVSLQSATASYGIQIPSSGVAFKEQQARIGELEAVLKKNGLLEP